MSDETDTAYAPAAPAPESPAPAIDPADDSTPPAAVTAAIAASNTWGS